MEISESKKFDSIYKKYNRKVFGAALGYMKDKYLAEEIFQETFFEMYRRIDEIQEDTAENWLLTVTKHKSFNLLKRLAFQQEKTGYFEVNTELLQTDIYGNLQRVETEKEYKDFSRELFEGLYEENERWYEAIVRVYCLGGSQKEVAGEMGMNSGTLYSLIFRARGWIKRHYGRKYEEIFSSNR